MDGILKRTVDDHTIYEILTCIPEKKIQRKKGFIKKLFGSAITSGSLINEINGLAKGISDIYILDVPVGYDTGSIIKEFSRRFMFWGYDVEELYCPMKPMNDPEHFISYDAGVAVFTCNNIHDRKLFELDNVIYTVKISHPDENTSDFLNYYNLLSESKKDIDKAVARLSVAKKMHDELEAYYVDAMDFDGISDIRNKLISKINRYK